MTKHRHSIRLKNYDYSRFGLYFVTICAQKRKCLFGNVVNEKMVLNEFGIIVDKKINELKKYKNIDIDIYCVMPNHVHLILIIVGAGPCACPCLNRSGSGLTQGSTPTLDPTLGEYIKRLKTLTTHIYIENIKKNNWSSFDKRLWQRNYYEHIIRNEIELFKTRQYITTNSLHWKNDINYE